MLQSSDVNLGAFLSITEDSEVNPVRAYEEPYTSSRMSEILALGFRNLWSLSDNRTVPTFGVIL